jgi:hypothetical protein
VFGHRVAGPATLLRTTYGAALKALRETGINVSG